MAPEKLPPTIVVLNPDEDCSPAACREILDEIIDHPDEPSIESLNAAEVLRKLRSPDA
ncbi:MAG: hypothetical protein WD023_05890 [Ilumatobacteraceae bacterium]